MVYSMERDGQGGYDNEEGRGYAAAGARGGAYKKNDHLCKLFVGGLDARTSEDILRSHFEKYGKTTDAVIVMDPETMNSRGYGFVTFEESNAVDEALNEMPHNIFGKEVDTKRALPRGQNPNVKSKSLQTKKLFVGGAKELSESDEHLCKLFVGGLDPRTSENTLRAHFEKYGKITDATIVMDPETMNSRGYGFITFQESKVVDEALNHSPHNIFGKDVDTKRALPRGQNTSGKSDSPQAKQLFVAGTKELSESELREAFCPYGEIVKIVLPTDRETKKKRGFAFVEFADSRAANKAASQGSLLIDDTEVTVHKAKAKSELYGGEDIYGGEESYGGGYALGGYGGLGGFGSRGGYGQESAFVRGRGGRGMGGYGGASFSGIGYGMDSYSRGVYAASLLEGYDDEALYEEASLYGRGLAAPMGGFGDYDEGYGGVTRSFGRARGARVAPYGVRGAAAGPSRGAGLGYSRGAGLGYSRGGYSSRGGYY